MIDTDPGLRFSFNCPNGNIDDVIESFVKEGSLALIVRPIEFYKPNLSGYSVISGRCDRAEEERLVNLLSGPRFIPRGKYVKFEDLATARVNPDTTMIEISSWRRRVNLGVISQSVLVPTR